jgi:hypothetical protein
VNELGFHGDMRPNPRIEDEYFFKNESQSAGINFDKVREKKKKKFVSVLLFYVSYPLSTSIPLVSLV